jgi:L-ribulose-5-phosphate 4-epimerase
MGTTSMQGTDGLREQACNANIKLAEHGLVLLTFGNVSGIDRGRGLVAIKPSGVSYDSLTPKDIVVVDLDGNVVEGDLHPSSDTPTHLVLYRAFPGIGGIAHTHSTHATMFAQAARGIPCFGTTHADVFHGEVPCTRPLTEDEIRRDYEENTGRVVVEEFEIRVRGSDRESDADSKGGTPAEQSGETLVENPRPTPLEMPAVLVAAHGPFTWGANAIQAVEHAVVLEEIARTAIGTLRLAPEAPPIPRCLLERHYSRKHGSDAYYGQNN